MAKKIKILLWSLAATAVIGAAFAAGSYLSPHPLAGHIEGEVLATSVSPSGRWKIKLYMVNSGASDRNYIVVTDQTGGTPAREIDFEGTEFTGDTLRWKSNDTVNLYGQETNVRLGTVILKRSISPNGRWHIEVYDSFPVGRRSGKTWAILTDQRNKQLNRKVLLNRGPIHRDFIRWKSPHIVDVDGQVINVRKLMLLRLFTPSPK